MHCGECTNEEVCNKVWLQGFYGALVIQYLESGGAGNGEGSSCQAGT
jgi:hypothetical protein